MRFRNNILFRICSPFAFLIIIFCQNGCSKIDKPGYLKDSAGIALTFDDYYVDNWYEFLPMLDSAGVKATFYISSYHRFTPEQIEKLKIIRDHGNEIGYHTTNHINIPKYIKSHGLDKLRHNEIDPDLAKMRADGFNPVVFAYPFGAHSTESDNYLACLFKSVRTLNGTNNYSKSLTETCGETMLHAMEMDESSNRSEYVYDEMLEAAKRNGNCFLLVGHRIGNGINNLKVPLSRLRHIIARANQLGLRFYTVSEISKK